MSAEEMPPRATPIMAAASIEYTASASHGAAARRSAPQGGQAQRDGEHDAERTGEDRTGPVGEEG